MGEVQGLVGEPRRDARHPARPRRGLGAARDDARPDGRRRGDAHLHLPEPVRLPDRCGDRQPRLPGRARRAPTSAPGASVQQEELERVREGFAPVPVLRAPYFESEVTGRGDARPARRTPCSATGDPAALLHTGLAQEFGLDDGRGEVRLAVPFAGKGDVSLKKVGDELVVRVDGRKRTVVLPPALAALRAGGRGARRRRAGGALCLSGRRPATRSARTSTRRTPPPTGWCARRSARPRRPPPGRGAAARLGLGGRERGAGVRARPPGARSGCSTACATRSPPSSRASSPRRCATCCWRCARWSTGTSSGSASPHRRATGADVEDIPLD